MAILFVSYIRCIILLGVTNHPSQDLTKVEAVQSQESCRSAAAEEALAHVGGTAHKSPQISLFLSYYLVSSNEAVGEQDIDLFILFILQEKDLDPVRCNKSCAYIDHSQFVLWKGKGGMLFLGWSGPLLHH